MREYVSMRGATGPIHHFRLRRIDRQRLCLAVRLDCQGVCQRTTTGDLTASLTLNPTAASNLPSREKATC